MCHRPFPAVVLSLGRFRPFRLTSFEINLNQSLAIRCPFDIVGDRLKLLIFEISFLNFEFTFEFLIKLTHRKFSSNRYFP